ncbi:MAG: ATP-grasp domain-containing protein [Planctomycetaceae bacterium]
MEGDVILAGASVRSLAESAIRSGLRPICVDMFGDADLQLALNEIQLTSQSLHLIQRFTDVPNALKNVSTDIPLIPVGGLENDQTTIQQLRKQRSVWLADDRTLDALQNPDQLFGTLQQQGCSVPRWQTGTAADNSVRWLKKKLRSAGGTGVTFHTSHTSHDLLKGGWNEGSSADSQKFHLQEFIDGVPLSATFLSGPSVPQLSHQVRLLGCALQLSGCGELYAPGFQFCGNAGPVVVPTALQTQLQLMAQTIVDHWPIIGVFGIDVIVRNGVAFLLEVNARPTASHELHERDAPASGHVKLHCDAWRSKGDDEMAREFQDRRRSKDIPASEIRARLVIYADRNLRLSQDQQRQLLCHCRPIRLTTESRPDVWLADIPSANTLIPRQTPFCSVYLPLPEHADKRLSDSGRQVLKMLPVSITNGLTHLFRRIQCSLHHLELH